jgi:hypothetical protein
VRNDEYPDRVGRVLLKDLAAPGEEGGSWRGQVYAQRLEEYKDAEISLPKPDFMEIKVKVGFKLVIGRQFFRICSCYRAQSEIAHGSE